MRRLGLRGVLTTALAALVIPLAGAGTASASTSVWPAAAALGLPGGATGAVSLPSVSCGSSSQCVAVGAYTSATNAIEPMVATATNGAWGAGMGIALPSGASSGSLASVSCTGAGTCIAVGEDDASAHPIAATEASNAWGPAGEVTGLPSGASGGSLSGISCQTGGNCTAVGTAAIGGSDQPMGFSVTAGVFGQGARIPLPSGGTSGTLTSVACTSPGNCFAVGHYVDAGGQTQAMVAAQIAGAWEQVSEVALPAGAAAAQGATLSSIACPASGQCKAVGSYSSASGQQTAMLVLQSAGTWGQAVPLTLPAGATASRLDSISCTTSSACTATGAVLAGTAAPLAATDTGGTWSAGIALQLPSGAISNTSLPLVSLAVGCTGASHCDAAGTYPGASGVGAMTVNSHPSLAITSHSLPAGAVGRHYSARIATSGGTGGNVWTFTGGSLPAGLTFNPATGAVSGTPTTDQTTTFSVSVHDNASPPDQATGTVSIRIGPATKPPKTTKTGTGTSSGKGKGKKSKRPRGAKIGAIKVLHGSDVRLTVKCLRQRHCDGRVAVVVVEHLRGRKVIAINASTHRAHGTRTRTVWLGSVRYALRDGKKVTRTIRLNRTGTRLLKARHKLKAGVALRPASFKHATIEHTVKLHVVKAKKHTKQSTHKKKGTHSG